MRGCAHVDSFLFDFGQAVDALAGIRIPSRFVLGVLISGDGREGLSGFHRVGLQTQIERFQGGFGCFGFFSRNAGAVAFE